MQLDPHTLRPLPEKPSLTERQARIERWNRLQRVQRAVRELQDACADCEGHADPAANGHTPQV
jgi:hypothetical protein